MIKKGFIFDLDGVIVDTARYHFLAWKRLAKTLGINFTATQNEQLKGVSRKKSLEKILSWGNKDISQDRFKTLMSKKNEDYLNYIANMDESDILSGVVEILDYLTKNKQAIALGSVSKNARVILRKVNLIEQFDAIVDGNDISKGKPDPEVFLKAAKLIDVKPENCIVIEDSIAGVQAAKVANMLSIGIGEKKILRGAAYVFKTPGIIRTDFIKQLIEK